MNYKKFLALGPGLLLAATGVGGGDLATGTIVGSLLGTAILWAVVVGAIIKFVVTALVFLRWVCSDERGWHIVSGVISGF